ncbi:hypothetical protein H0H87_003429 [Tephrocybe sp. NHM501043]|nr:hypothetical protein H0H87_003429 [Tephrocybe sp. NHM501043]
MSLTHAQDMPRASSSKTLYTPVFYATPSPSLQGSDMSDKAILKAYLDRMSKQHIALATKVQEVPPSPTTPEAEEQFATRVEALRKRAVEAFKYAHGDPADGKWAALSQLLKLNVARGRTRWLDISTEGKMAEPSFGWINASTEEEWQELEEKLEEETRRVKEEGNRVKSKVESWQRKVASAPMESQPLVVISQQSQPGQMIQRVPTVQNILPAKEKQKSTSQTLGFAVVKRTSRTVINKPKGSVKASASNATAGPSSLSSRPLPRATEPPIDSSGSKPPRVIHQLSESSFLPPSFLSQLETSTPNKNYENKHKPEPIEPQTSSSPLPTPPNIRVYGRQRTMSVLSELPSTPTRYPVQPSTTVQAQREKRAHSVTPPQAMKKARIHEGSSPASPQSPPQVVNPITPVVTPKRVQLPRLTDLIQSAKKSKASRKTRSANTSSDVTPAPVSPHKPEVQPVIDEVHLESSIAAVQSEPSIAEAQPDPVMTEAQSELVIADFKTLSETAIPEARPGIEIPREEEEEEMQEEVLQPETTILKPIDKAELEPVEGLLAGPFEEDLTPGAYDYTTRLTNDEDDDDRDRSSVYNLIASPARSLSSLAASDSDSESDNGLDFAPPFTSTQVDGKEKTLGWMGYNSQFDVDGKVDMVSKFMENDVDFAGWLRDPSTESAGESQ